jgi:hypothetical protein
MKTIALSIDSGERDITKYPYPNDYTIRLNTSLYEVTNIVLKSTHIFNCQPLVNFGNKQFQVDDTTIVLNEGTYTNGADLASNLQTALVGTNVTSVQYNTFTKKLLFSNVGTSNSFSFKFFSGSNGLANTTTTVGTPASVLGFNGSDISSTNGTLSSQSAIDLSGPTSLFLRMTCDGDDLMMPVYTDSGTFSFNRGKYKDSDLQNIPPVYLGRLDLGNIDALISYQSPSTTALIEYPVQKLNIRTIRIRFYWNNGTKLIPYDFGTRNHMLQFNITCETDRLVKTYPDSPAVVGELPPPVAQAPEAISERFNIMYVVLFAILFLGLVVLMYPNA